MDGLNERNGSPRRGRGYGQYYVIIVLGLFALFLFKGTGLISGIIISLKDVDFFRGIYGSPWAGLDNFAIVFHDPAFRQALINTLLIKGGYLVITSAVALIAALALSGIRSAKLRSACATPFLIPWFLPSAILAYLVAIHLSPDHSPFLHLHGMPLGEPASYRPILIMTEVLKTCGIPIMLALAAIGGQRSSIAGADEASRRTDAGFYRMNVIPAIRAIAAFWLMQLSAVLTTNYELADSLSNPLVRQAADTVDLYWFRKGFMMANMGPAEAVWMFQFVVQLVLSVLAYLLIRRYFIRDLFRSEAGNAGADPVRSGSGMAGYGLSIVYAALLVLLVYPILNALAHHGPVSGSGAQDLFSANLILGYAGLYLLAVVINLLISLVLAYPLTVRNLPGRGLYKLCLLIFLVMGSYSIHDYLFVRSSGMLNTVFPLFFSGWLTLMNVFVLKSVFNAKMEQWKEPADAGERERRHSFFRTYAPNVWKPLIGLGVLQFANLWNSYMPGLLYMANPAEFPPILQFKRLAAGGANAGIRPDDPLILVYGGLICLPALILLFVFRRFLTAEVFVSQVRDL